VLVNRKGDIKLCDFGISGELDKSLAKTNIGCQSYMAVRYHISSNLHPSTYSFVKSSPNVSKANPKITLAHTPSPPTFGLSAFP
jgi:mitogen-activated protein kinase kinase